MQPIRSPAVLALVVVLGMVAGCAITLLELHADASRRAQLQVGAIKFALADLESAPFSADPRAGGSPAFASATITAENEFINENLRSLIAAGSSPKPLWRIQAAVRGAGPAIEQIFVIGAYRGGYAGPERILVNREQRDLQHRVISTLALLTQAGQNYSRRAQDARREAVIGSLATILLLLSIFVLLYRRATVAHGRATLAGAAAERLSAENLRLLEASRDEAITDPLTTIGNRRAFKRDLEQILPMVDSSNELMVAMFDLDGFKQYNDTFGHPAGDALLARLAGALKDTAGESATAYRMGGDEFCLIAQTSAENSDTLLHAAVAALSDSGEGWNVGCSWGLAWMPSDATGPSEALRTADERMYAQKASRATAGYQTTAALVQVLVERDVDLGTHINRVAALSTATAQRLGVAEHEVIRIGLAAQLHDIGKAAIPDSILSKPGPLNEQEWTFIRCHTLIGERIIAAAPSLAHTAHLVRSSHERVDGTGYPDRLSGLDIPLGSRIIAVCDAFDAMTTPRPYRDQLSIADAGFVLRDCAGSQFDPEVVTALCAITLEPSAAESAATGP